MIALRDRVVTFARELVGLTADPSCPAHRARYLALIGPVETQARAAALATLSGCELVQRGILRAFITHPLLEHPYRDRKAGEDLLAIAREARAVLEVTATPQPGDIVIVGGGVDGGGPEHAWMVLEIDPDPSGAGYLVTGLDGGQRDGRDFECIKIRGHAISRGFDTVDGLRRRVRAVLDLDLIFGRFGRSDLDPPPFEALDLRPALPT